MRSFFLFFSLFCSFPFLAQAQSTGNIPVGTWRTHQSYQSLTDVVSAGSRIYAAARGAFFYVDLEDNSFHPLSRIDGFTGVDITDLKYHKDLDVVVVAYASGNIDLIKGGNEIININAIARSESVVGGRAINQIHLYGKFAYVSGGFGVAVVDLERAEIRENYTFRMSNGVSAEVFSCAVYNDELLLVFTREGFQAGRLQDNLLNSENWFAADSGAPHITTDKVVHLATLEGKTYFFYSYVYQFTGDRWQVVSPYVDQNYNTDVSVSDDQVVFSSLGEAMVFNPVQRSVQRRSVGTFVQDAVLDDQGCLWTADANQGLFASCAPGEAVSYLPAGPIAMTAFKLYSYNNQVTILHGGYTPSSQPANQNAGFSIFENGRWQSYSNRNGSIPYTFVNAVDAAYNPVDGHYYVASYTNGLLDIAPDSNMQLWTDQNSTLTRNVWPRVVGVAVDPQGDVWLTNAFAPNRPLHVKRQDGTWEAFDMRLTSQELGPRGPRNLLIDDNGFKWVRLWGGSVVVFDDQQNRSRVLTMDRNGLPSNEVLAMAKDQDGLIWVGTSAGLGVFYNTYEAFDTDIQAERPRVRVSATEAEYLLRDAEITALAIDGGNRKWIGTRSGLFLIAGSENEEVAHFTTANSPLASNEILDLTINDVTGEVFIAQEEGVISYRAVGTAAEATHSNALVFPNPVPPNYSGQITISGLARNASVKITDISGKLVYETQAIGGAAAWNGFDYNGRRASPGIYLVFSASEDGMDGLVTKIALVE
ncbi:Por secretion system C-terminal sorting domain-containing protein [Catalinimonas alkaloidigena]|uniref:Por secretion system C-terminal sorting domain-containing protein n=1 Tax=Catalinimonas alkaloidigena TaxID=1075417 RepID=A0A1G9EH35_9BACT|nr:two-component regulator propeller domain-containing protein [Catalinimonas alkaloidigena]SDK75487.1 Por secretion system C-terminal sorting domain-containing protein [Catalinimonas alkaloidigena]